MRSNRRLVPASPILVLWLCIIVRQYYTVTAFVGTQHKLPLTVRTSSFSRNDVDDLTRMAAGSLLGATEWVPLTVDAFSEVQMEGIQIESDAECLDRVRQAWQADRDSNSYSLETCVCEYKDDQQSNLFGHVVRRVPEKNKNDSKIPGIVLFPGPRGVKDVELFRQADRLLQEMDCVVLLADLLSDAYGWTWMENNGGTYVSVRDALLADDGQLLRNRCDRAVRALAQDPEGLVDPHRMAVVGWSLGGQALLELGRLAGPTSAMATNQWTIQAMVSVSGVFQRATPMPPRLEDGVLEAEVVADESATDDKADKKSSRTILVCTGGADSLVTPADLEVCKKLWEANGWTDCRIETYPDATQGFDRLTGDQYDAEAAEQAHESLVKVLRDALE